MAAIHDEISGNIIPFPSATRKIKSFSEHLFNNIKLDFSRPFNVAAIFFFIYLYLSDAP